MTRRFYTDPLAAEWMAKHFGMRFRGFYNSHYSDVEILFNGADGYFHSGVVDDYDPDSVPSDICGISPRQYFIHSESLHLLEPLVGDLLTSGEEIHNSIAVATLSDLERCGVGVIRRKGIPFMWPEQEAA